MAEVSIKQFKDVNDALIAGLTPEKAVYDENGVRLDDKLREMNIDNIHSEIADGIDAISAQTTDSINAVKAQEDASVEVVRQTGEELSGTVEDLVNHMENYNIDELSGLTWPNAYTIEGSKETVELEVVSGCTSTGTIIVTFNTNTTFNVNVDSGATTATVASAIATAANSQGLGFNVTATGSTVKFVKSAYGRLVTTITVNGGSTGVVVNAGVTTLKGSMSALTIANAMITSEQRRPGIYITFKNPNGETESWEYLGGTFTSKASWGQFGSTYINRLFTNSGKVSETISGVTYDVMAVDTVFDITSYKGGEKFASLSAALGTSGANVPTSVRKGGMTVKFIHSSDNKYVQCRLMANDWSTDTDDWQECNDSSIKDTTPDFAVSDEVGNAVLIVSEGEIKTKKFNSSDIKNRIDTIASTQKVVAHTLYIY